MQQRIEKLEALLFAVIFPDRFEFPRTVKHTGNKLSFYSAAPVKQYISTLEQASFTIPSGGTPIKTNSATTGGVGTTYYTPGDVVAALKLLGLILK